MLVYNFLAMGSSDFFLNFPFPFREPESKAFRNQLVTPVRYDGPDNPLYDPSKVFVCFQCGEPRAKGVIIGSQNGIVTVCGSCVMLTFAQVPPADLPQKALLIALIEANCNALATALMADPATTLIVAITDNMRHLRELLRELCV